MVKHQNQSGQTQINSAELASAMRTLIQSKRYRLSGERRILWQKQDKRKSNSKNRVRMECELSLQMDQFYELLIAEFCANRQQNQNLPTSLTLRGWAERVGWDGMGKKGNGTYKRWRCGRAQRARARSRKQRETAMNNENGTMTMQ